MPSPPSRLDLAPDPADARRWLARLGAGLPPALSDDVAHVLWLACTQAPYLAMLAAPRPALLLAAAGDQYLRREKPRDRMAAELAVALAGTADATDLGRRLREYRARELIRLGARECGLGDPEEVGRELAHLADVSLDAAVAFHDAELARAHGEPRFLADDGSERRAGLVVIGMGKLGGEELNFASDIDILYVYSSDAGQAGELSLHQYFDLLARRVTRSIGDLTEDGAVFRVDLRLRPEGSRGPLVNSLPSLERYYEAWGRPWERQAWLKARPVAGDLDLGAEALEVLEPFIYPRTTGATVIRDVAELNQRIKAELVDGKRGGVDVKLGHGGIREIEFFVQALQLVHAGKNPAVRERSTRRALERLLFAGHLAERERRVLADAYAFLRQVEHRLQLESGRQTHSLPSDMERLEVLARRLGFADAAELTAVLDLRMKEVAQIFATLGAKPELAPEIAVVLDHGRSQEELAAALAALGFRDPDAASFHVELCRRRPASPLGAMATGAAARVAAALVQELAASPDPDQALRYAVDLVSRRGTWDGLWQLLDENRPLLRLIISLFGTSDFLARAFVDHPELIDTLLLVGRGGPRRNASEIEAVIAARLATVAAGDDEGAFGALRRIKNEELLRVGLAEIAGDLALDAACEQLTDLADACIKATFERVRAALLQRHMPVAPMAVLGLGKLGGREMGYASDLDLVFVYDAAPGRHLDDGAQERATKLAQRLVHALGAVLDDGRLYQVDTRLRPSGREGTLVTSLAAFRQYHAERAELWERQALLKCRAVAGDAGVGQAACEAAERFVHGSGPPDARTVAAELSRMRDRIEKELARDAGAYDLKTGRGGLLDVEFAAQFLQLVHGPTVPALRVRATIPAIEAAAAEGLIDDQTRATLVGGYRFLRLLENRMRIVHDRPIHALPRDPVELDKLARRTAFPSASALERAYLAWTGEVRACYLRLLGVAVT